MQETPEVGGENDTSIRRVRLYTEDLSRVQAQRAVCIYVPSARLAITNVQKESDVKKTSKAIRLAKFIFRVARLYPSSSPWARNALDRLALRMENEGDDIAAEAISAIYMRIA